VYTLVRRGRGGKRKNLEMRKDKRVEEALVVDDGVIRSERE